MEVADFVKDGVAYTSVNGVLGTLNNCDMQTLVDCAQKLGNESKYLETGSYLGCSALLVALNSNATVWAHDLWVTDWSELKGDPPPRVDDYFYKFYKAVKDNNLTNRVIPIRGNSVYTLGIHDDNSIDLAFIDGDHSYAGCLEDLRAILPKMKSTGTILVHDCVSGSEPLQAVAHFVQDNNLRGEEIPGSWGMIRITR